MSRPSPAAARAVAVINFFVEHPRQSFTLTEIVKSLKLSRATCHALLATLVQTGYLYRLSGKRYVIGPALISAGRIAREAYSPLEIARTEMRDLADETDAICTAMFREKYEMVVRDRAGSMFHLGWLPPVGQRVSMNTPREGMSLAWEDERTVREWLGAIGATEDSADVTALRSAMAIGRERGYVANIRDTSWSEAIATTPVQERIHHLDTSQKQLDDDTVYSLSSIIAPVRDASGVAFLISLSFFRRDLAGREISEIAHKLIAACQRISDFVVRAAVDDWRYDRSVP